MIAASMLTHLRIDPQSARVFVRFGMFEIMLRTLESGSTFPLIRVGTAA